MPSDDRHVAVATWGDIDGAPEASGVAKQRVAMIFTEQSWDYVVWVPHWLLEDGDKDIATVTNSDHLAVGDVEDYSAKAWRLIQRHRERSPESFLPKSQVIVFERLRGVETIETPQTGLSAFARGGSDA
jgi:hypothetical protein